MYIAIERNWGAAKRFARDNCGYTITARSIIPQALASIGLFLSRRFYLKSLRYLAIYEAVKCSAPLADLICRTYRSHRRVTDSTVEGAIRKAAQANPEQRSALLSLLDPDSQPLVPAAPFSAAGSADEDEEAEAVEDDGNPAWEIID